MQFKKELQEKLIVEAASAVTAYAGLSIRTAVLINGAGAIALLTFVGNRYEDAPPAGLGYALLFFAAGVLFCAVAGGFVYLAQFHAIYSEFYVETKDTRASKRFRWASIALIAASYACFSLAMVCSYAAIFHPAP